MNIVPRPDFRVPEPATVEVERDARGNALQELQVVIDGLADKVAVIDSDGAILLVNRLWRREVEQRGSWDFQIGLSYSDGLAALVEAGDTRIEPILSAFQDISSGARRSFHCVYVGSGIFSGHDYKVLLSALGFAGNNYVLVSAQDLTEVNALKRQRRRFGTQVLRAQEEERRRIARDIHDSTAQLLVALQLNLMNLHAGDGPEAEALIADCKQVVSDIHREIRSLSFMAHPPPLSHNDLAGALERLTAGFASRTGLGLDLQLSDVGEASASVEAAIYRLAQEALSNIHRHSAATHAGVRLVGTLRCLHLAVSDDGIGFDAHDGVNKAAMGVGVPGMAERVRELGGRFSIRRVANGTLLTACIPRRKSLISVGD